MSAPRKPSPDSIDVTTVLGTLVKSGRTILGLSALAGVVAYGVFSTIKPVFVSEAQIAIVARLEGSPFSDPQKDGGGDNLAVRMDREAINTHVRALQAPELAQRVVEELKLADKSEFSGLDGGIGGIVRGIIGGQRDGRSGNAGERALSALQKKLEVFPGKESRAISIRVSSSDRELAAQIANLLAERYRDSLASRTMVESGDVQKALSPRIDELMKETGAAEAEIERFRASANIFRGGAQTGLNEQQLSELTAAESKSRTELGEAEARARTARDLLKRGTAEGLPDVQRSTSMQKLTQERTRIEAEIAKARATMKDGHPVIKQMRAEQAEVDLQLKVEIKRVVESFEKEVGVAKLRLDSVRAELAEVKKRVAATGTDQARLTQLEANARTKRAELERLQGQFEANRARADRRVVPVAAQIIALARPATSPTFPKPAPYALIAALAAMLAGIAIVLVRALASGARGGPAAVAALKPKAAREGRSTAAETPRGAALSLPAEAELAPVSAVKVAAERIAALGSGERAVRTLVAGANEQIDPGEQAMRIAEDLSRGGGNVLLIELAEGAGALARSLDISALPGVGDLIEGRAGFDQVIRPVRASAVQLMPAGRDLAGALERCDIDRLNLLLDVLDEAYAHVVVAGGVQLSRALFELIEGRFDAGVVVDSAWRKAAEAGAEEAGFLGFEVAGLEVLHVPVSEDSGAAVGQRQRGRASRTPRQAA